MFPFTFNDVESVDEGKEGGVVIGESAGERAGVSEANHCSVG